MVKISKYEKAVCALLSGGLAFLVLMILFKVKGFAPFGSLSLAVGDGEIQYLDFFGYLKNVFQGKDSLLYSYNKGLGGNMVGFFSYYLSSPINLLLLFFDAPDILSFYDLTAAVKIGLAASACSVFLSFRYEKTVQNNPTAYCFVVALSVCYAFCQYIIRQTCNVMWLDGPYMLPLILLGVYYVVNNRKEKWLLALFVCLSILFNWYTAAMNCFFSIVWFIVEYLLREVPVQEPVIRYKQPKKNAAKDKAGKLPKGLGFWNCLVNYVLYMALGVALSAVLFLPAALSLGDGDRGGLQTWLFADKTLANPFPSIIKNYRPGYVSEKYDLSLYCGVLPVLGILGAFLTPSIKIRKKIVYLCMLAFLCIMFYWSPMIVLFSVIRKVDSYWYRYSYLGSFLLVFLAAEFFLTLQIEKESLKKLCFVAAVLAVVLTCGDMWNHAVLTTEKFSAANVEYFRNYMADGQKQVDEIKEADPSLYRISQTADRGGAYTTANKNEGLAFNYKSISSYTSAPSDRELYFLERMGYRTVYNTWTQVNTSVLPTDALLGVKYVLSPFPIKGLERLEGLGNYNGKDVYQNPFSLPFSFAFQNGGEGDMTYFEFENINTIYSQLSGREVSPFEPVEFSVTNEEDGRRYTIRIPEGNYTLYGCLPFYYDTWATIEPNGSYTAECSVGNGSSVFYIPVEAGETEVSVKLRSANLDYQAVGYEQFYALDLDQMQALSEELASHSAEVTQLETTRISVNYLNDSGMDSLYVSVPYDKRWKIRRNGEEVNCSLLGSCMYILPLTEGENVFEFRYSMPSLWIGALITVLAAAILYCLRKKLNKKT